jgi:hypothetical protein
VQSATTDVAVSPMREERHENQKTQNTYTFFWSIFKSGTQDLQKDREVLKSAPIVLKAGGLSGALFSVANQTTKTQVIKDITVNDFNAKFHGPVSLESYETLLLYLEGARAPANMGISSFSITRFFSLGQVHLPMRVDLIDAPGRPPIVYGDNHMRATINVTTSPPCEEELHPEYFISFIRARHSDGDKSFLHKFPTKEMHLCIRNNTDKEWTVNNIVFNFESASSQNFTQSLFKGPVILPPNAHCLFIDSRQKLQDMTHVESLGVNGTFYNIRLGSQPVMRKINCVELISEEPVGSVSLGFEVAKIHVTSPSS